MTYNLGDPEWFVTVADADTPASLTQWAGRIIGVPPNTPLPPEGTIAEIVVAGLNLWGYLRRDQNGNRQWVIAGQPNPNVVAVNAIPQRGQWTDLSARNIYYTIGQALLGMGVSGGDLRPGLANLYNAAVADYVAAVNGGHVPPPGGSAL
jgi:hypothetical protein